MSMDWFAEVNSYCERTDPSYWSEPVNALTNLAFILAGLICLRRLGERADRGVRLLIGLLILIGIGSYLFHTHAQIWALLADVLPILGFILVYVHLATTRFLRAPVWAGLLAAAAFLPYSMLVGTFVRALAGDLNGSVSYVPVPILIAAYALILRRRAPSTARGLAIGAAILTVSLVFRTVDTQVCTAFPIGTHFLWHILNALMLGWMIAVLLRHGDRGLAARPGPR